MPFTPVASTAVWLDGSGGSDLNDGFDSAHPVLTAAKALTQVGTLDQKILYYKNVRECIAWTASNLSMLLWDQSVPASRGDTIVTGAWTNVSGNTWKSAAFTPALANVGTVVIDYETATAIAGGGVPAHLYQAANVAGLVVAKLTASGGSGTFTYNETVTQTTSGATGKFIQETGGFVYVSKVNGSAFDASNHALTGGTSGATRTVVSAVSLVGDTYTVADDAGTSRLYVNTTDGIDPNSHVVAYTEHRTGGAECNGIDLTGDSNYVEAYPALWTEGAGSGNGSNGKGGWGVILRGNNNRIFYFGARDCGYKWGATSGDMCIIDGASTATLAGMSNTATQGVDGTNGNAGITLQGPAAANMTSGVVRGLIMYCHGLLWRLNSKPINSGAWAGGFQAILCHAQGLNTVGGAVVDQCSFNTPFDVTIGYTYCGNCGAVPAIGKTTGSGHPFTVRRCTFGGDGNGIRNMRIQEHAWFDRNKIYATKGINFGGVVESLSGASSQIITATGNLFVYNGDSAGSGYGFGNFWYITTANGMEVYSIGNTYVNTFATNSNQSWALFDSTGGSIYSRQDLLFMPDNGVSIGNKRLFHAADGSHYGASIDVEYMYCVGVGTWETGTAFTLPATFDGTHAATGTCQAFTDAAASTLFPTPLTTLSQVGSDYHLKAGAAATLLARNFITPHMTADPDGIAYYGQFGCYPYLADSSQTMRSRGGIGWPPRNRRPCP